MKEKVNGKRRKGPYNPISNYWIKSQFTSDGTYVICERIPESEGNSEIEPE